MPTALSARDPFSHGYDELIAVLKAHAPLTAAVRVANWISFEGEDPDPKKGAVLDGDLPELTIKPAGGPFDLFHSSTSALFKRTFIIGIVTPDKRIDAHMFKLEWLICCALYCGYQRLRSIPFVTGIHTTAIETEETDESPEDARRMGGWYATMAITLDLVIDRNQFLA